MTPLTKQVLIILFSLYVAQLLAESWLGLPVTSWLAWWPISSGRFQPWQPLTCWLLGAAEPLRQLFAWIVLYFFLPPAERALGRTGLKRLTIAVVVACAVLGMAMDALGVTRGAGAQLGIEPLLSAYLVVFGLAHPGASILLFFVLPVRAIWIVWGSGVIALLSFLATRGFPSALVVIGWVVAWAWMNRSRLRRSGLSLGQRSSHARTQRKLRRFEVLEGGREDGAPRTSGNGSGRPLWPLPRDDDDDPIVH